MNSDLNIVVLKQMSLGYTSLPNLNHKFPRPSSLLIKCNSPLSNMRRIQLRILPRNLPAHFHNSKMNLLPECLVKRHHHVLLTRLRHRKREEHRHRLFGESTVGDKEGG